MLLEEEAWFVFILIQITLESGAWKPWRLRSKSQVAYDRSQTEQHFPKSFLSCRTVLKGKQITAEKHFTILEQNLKDIFIYQEDKWSHVVNWNYTLLKGAIELYCNGPLWREEVSFGRGMNILHKMVQDGPIVMLIRYQLSIRGLYR